MARETTTIELRVYTPELILAGESLPVTMSLADDARVALRIAVSDEAGQLIDARVARPSRGTATSTIDDLPPGAYTTDVAGLDAASPVAPVSSAILVWG